MQSEETQLITATEEPIEELLSYQNGTPGTPHAKVREKLRACLKMAWDSVSNRFDDWDRVDEQTRLYMDLTRAARAGDKSTIYNLDGTMKREMPFTRSIVIPVSYVILNVRLSQFMNILIGRKPIWPLDGRGPEDVSPSRMMESVLDYDMEQCRALLSIYQFFQDAEKYGQGVIYDTFTSEYGWVLDERFRIPGNLQLAKALQMDPSDSKVWDVAKEYNCWDSVDPFCFWPDPRVPRADVQKGEFVGHRTVRSYLYILERSQENDGVYFNVDYLKNLRQSESITAYTPRRDEFLGPVPDKATTDEDNKGYYNLDHFQVRLIPREWGLGEGSIPEIWWFTMANEEIIIRAHESSYDHGQFTYAIGESNIDKHALFNPGNMENLEPIQRFINWLLNSHFENIRKHLNDMLIYSPTYIEEEDILNPGPARHIRLTQAGEELIAMGGLTPKSFIEQLAVGDVTTPHLQAAQFLWEMITRMFATSDPDMGHPTEEKKTLGEINQVISGSSKRIAVAFRMYEVMAFHQLVARSVANRQQFTSLDQYFRIIGDMTNEPGGRRMMVTPWDLQGNFDYSPRSDVLPPDPAKTAIAWTQLIMGLGKFPQILAPGPDGKMLDIRKIFNEVARGLGVRNISEFYIDAPPQVQVLPDEEVQKQVQAGNMIPQGGM